MPSKDVANPSSASRLLVARTDGRTNGRTTHLPETSSVTERAGETEKWIIRKRWSHMYGSPGYYWRVSHSSLPAYFGHALHCYTFEDAVKYACDHAKAVAS